MRDEYRIAMRRFTSLLRIGTFFILAICVYSAIRFVSVAGESATTFPDSLGYEHATFFGTNERFWAVPLFYSVVHTSHQRVLLHVVFGSLAWAYLAWQIGLLARCPKTMIAAVLLIGLTPQVIHFDLAILSESLGISFAVASVAATLHLAQTRTRLSKFSWLIFLVLTAFTRPIHLVVLIACALYCIVAYFFSGRKKRKTSAIVLSCLSIWGFMQLKGNETESTLNFYTVLQRRILPDDSSYTWFIKNGMPDIAGIRNAHGYGTAEQLDPAVREIVQLPIKQTPPMSMVIGGSPLAEWVKSRGWSTYTRYVLAHPSSARSIIAKRTPQSLSTSDEGFLPTKSHSFVPRQIFNPWWAWSMILFSSLLITWFSRVRAVIARALTASTLLASVVFVLSLLMSAIEYERHSVTVAVILRVLALASFAAATGSTKITEPDESVDAPV